MANEKIGFRFKLTLLTVLYVTHHCRAKVLRNNALMNKMVSHFQDNNDFQDKEHEDKHQRTDKVMLIMQNVLCRNFPSIPCKMIVEDETLKKLIGKSIQQLKYKKLSMEKTTASPGHQLTFPTVDSEDLSNFLEEHEAGYYGVTKRNDLRKTHKKNLQRNFVSSEKLKGNQRNKKGYKKTAVYSNRKKIKKFYPHKVKYKDRNERNDRNIGDYSQEKLSMSVEVPDMTLTKRHQHLSYKMESEDPPVWRIDYMKHGEPSLNLLGYGTDSLKGKLMDTGPSVVVDENVLERGARRDVLHPDVYIKKNFVKRSNGMVGSEDTD